MYFSFVVGIACLMWKFARVPFPPKATVLSTNELEFPEEVRTDLRAVIEELAVLGFESAEALRLDYGSLSTAFSVAFKSQGTTLARRSFETIVVDKKVAAALAGPEGVTALLEVLAKSLGQAKKKRRAA